MDRTLNSLSLLICSASLMLSACSKSAAPEAPTPSQTQAAVNLSGGGALPCSTRNCREEEARNDARTRAYEHDQKLAAIVAAGPKPNPSTPDSTYKEVASDFDAGVLRQAFGAHMNEDDIGSHFRNVVTEPDAFKKAERQRAAAVKVESAVQALAGDRYVILRVGVSLKPFDMPTRSFKVDGLDHSLIRLNVGDTLFGSGFVLTNGGQVVTWKVADEETARKVEGLRSKGQLWNMSADVYGFVVGSIPGNDDQLDVVVTKAILRDGSGVELVTLRP